MPVASGATTKGNLNKRLSLLSPASILKGPQVGKLEFKVEPACSDSTQIIQAVLRSEVLHFTGFTEVQLQLIQEDPVSVLHLEKNTYSVVQGWRNQLKVPHTANSSHSTTMLDRFASCRCRQRAAAKGAPPASAQPPPR